MANRLAAERGWRSLDQNRRICLRLKWMDQRINEVNCGNSAQIGLRKHFSILLGVAKKGLRVIALCSEASRLEKCRGFSRFIHAIGNLRFRESIQSRITEKIREAKKKRFYTNTVKIRGVTEDFPVPVPSNIRRRLSYSFELLHAKTAYAQRLMHLQIMSSAHCSNRIRRVVLMQWLSVCRYVTLQNRLIRSAIIFQRQRTLRVTLGWQLPSELDIPDRRAVLVCSTQVVLRSSFIERLRLMMRQRVLSDGAGLYARQRHLRLALANLYYRVSANMARPIWSTLESLSFVTSSPRRFIELENAVELNRRRASKTRVIEILLCNTARSKRAIRAREMRTAHTLRTFLIRWKARTLPNSDLGLLNSYMSMQTISMRIALDVWTVKAWSRVRKWYEARVVKLRSYSFAGEFKVLRMMTSAIIRWHFRLAIGSLGSGLGMKLNFAKRQTKMNRFLVSSRGLYGIGAFRKVIQQKVWLRMQLRRADFRRLVFRLREGLAGILIWKTRRHTLKKTLETFRVLYPPRNIKTSVSFFKVRGRRIFDSWRLVYVPLSIRWRHAYKIVREKVHTATKSRLLESWASYWGQIDANRVRARAFLARLRTLAPKTCESWRNYRAQILRRRKAFRKSQDLLLVHASPCKNKRQHRVQGLIWFLGQCRHPNEFQRICSLRHVWNHWYNMSGAPRPLHKPSDMYPPTIPRSVSSTGLAAEQLLPPLPPSGAEATAILRRLYRDVKQAASTAAVRRHFAVWVRGAGCADRRASCMVDVAPSVPGGYGSLHQKKIAARATSKKHGR
jgi:hypothetical protein